MSDYSELIKRFDSIRDYMRDFYLYGFKTREDFHGKSLRSYDNEKRRIESYLSEYMAFRQESAGKNVFLSVDSREIVENPFYRAFQAKSFTKNDIALHFYLLDLLQPGAAMTAPEIAQAISCDYLSAFPCPAVLDLSTIRKKLAEYQGLGILTARKQGKKLYYSLAETKVDLSHLGTALPFFSQVSPLGVVGSYLKGAYPADGIKLSFKHHYIMHALDSEIIYQLLEAIHGRKELEIISYSRRRGGESPQQVIPLRLLISVQGGRQYLSAYSFRSQAILNFRLDYLKSTKIIGESSQFDRYQKKLDEILSHTWGSSFGKGRNLEHLEMTLLIPQEERFILRRIQREGRHGVLTQLDGDAFLYTIDVYDTMEMLPWLRTFTGRILRLKCDNQAVSQTFYRDLRAMTALYQGALSEQEDL